MIQRLSARELGRLKGGDNARGTTAGAKATGRSHSQMSKERHWFMQPGASYDAMLIQFSVKDVAFCAMAAWSLAARR